MEDKQIVHQRIAFVRSKQAKSDVNAIAAQAILWFRRVTNQWVSAPLKRGDTDALIERCKAASSFTEAIRLVGLVFSDPTKLGACFPLPVTELVECENLEEDDLSAFDWHEADRCVKILVECSQGVANSMGHALRTLSAQLAAMSNNMTKGDCQLRALRIAMVADGLQTITQAQILRSFSHAPRERKERFARFLVASWGMADSVAWLNAIVDSSVRKEGRAFSFEYVEAVMHVLAILWQLNSAADVQSMPASAFTIPFLSEHAAGDENFLNSDFVRWHRSDKSAPAQSFTACPFALDTASKAHILQVIAEFEQREQFHQAAGGGDNPFLVIRVRREHLVDDTMNVLSTFAKTALRKPLKVQFVGEEGVDAGGVRKEYFLLMMRQLLDSSFGMFKEYDLETKLLWYNPDSLEAELQFELVGVLIGLAINNRVIVDVPFPRVFYKLLLCDEAFPGVTIEDLKELDPSLAQGLVALLEFDGDVESVFCRTFQVSRESWGDIRSFDLVPNGASLAVTNSNREDYVRLYVNWILVEAVRAQLMAFRRGFFSVLTTSLLRELLFTAEELELLVVGVRSLNFTALQESARYDDGYDETSQTIVAFWNVAHQLSDNEKRTLLKFITGSDRVPIRGLGDVRIVISRSGSDVDRLPASHTCFDHLLLPDYKDEEVLRAKLLIALQHAEGFFTR